MGNSPSIKLNDLTTEKKATSLLKPALADLQRDWARAVGVETSTINWKKSQINFSQFKQLMEPSWTDKELLALFRLYDFDGSGTITWREYVCVCAIVMAGTTEEKIKLLFSTFDEDGSGELSIEEFSTAAKKFSIDKTDKEREAFVQRVFKDCDKNGDGSVSFKEFFAWSSSHHDDFDAFTGAVNILK